MKQRQRGHETIARGEIGHGADLFDVGQQAFMGVNHPFGIALGAGSKQHHRRILRFLRQHRMTRRQQMREYPELIFAGNGIF